MISRTALISKCLILACIMGLMLTACKSKEAEVLENANRTAKQEAQTLTDEELIAPLPPKGTPEMDEIKKSYIAGRMANVAAKKTGQAPAAAAGPSGSKKSLAAAEAGQYANQGGAAPSNAQPGVTPGATAGGVRRATINSNFACRTKADCTSTKYSNAPGNADACGCQAGCTPFVVNNSEKARREAANKKLCSNKDWFGDECPAPPCGFIQFDNFACIDGKCVGYALGE